MATKKSASQNPEHNANNTGNTGNIGNTGNRGNTGPEGMPRNWMIPVVLLLLREWSSYGYDLIERMAAFGFAAMNPGSLYRVLRQLEKDGMVNSTWDTSGQGPARRMYSITDAGEDYLKVWASGIEYYRAMMNTFFRLYTGQPEDTTDSR